MSIEDLILWSRWLLVVAVICTSSFPVLFLFSPWYKSKLGRATMLQSATLALALELKLVLTFKPIDNRWFLVSLNFVILILISVASAKLTLSLWRLNYGSQEGVRTWLRKPARIISSRTRFMTYSRRRRP